MNSGPLSEPVVDNANKKLKRTRLGAKCGPRLIKISSFFKINSLVRHFALNHFRQNCGKKNPFKEQDTLEN
ncbi:hypothetical protein BpHYR1_052570 [Brachionus plicatilis]|uniref:Uncharacterized protein n=1 Tax=Brachionus plicatilis TaxID=10195 RepID=A0A3M7QUD3_BRAPC|nr:hypothetical protein BpHYR1_052570 [Brachionus plicatilis]